LALRVGPVCASIWHRRAVPRVRVLAGLLLSGAIGVRCPGRRHACDTHLRRGPCRVHAGRSASASLGSWPA
jgi:hypothetical protein